MENMSASQAAKALGISVDKLEFLEKQGILHVVEHQGEENFYSSEEISQIKSRHGLTLADEATKVNSEIQRETVSSISLFRKILIAAGSLITGYLLLVIVFAILFVVNPLQTSDFFGYNYRPNTVKKQVRTEVINGKRVLAAATGPATAVPYQTSVLADIVRPAAAVSLVAVKAIDDQKYTQIVSNPIGATGAIGQTGSPGSNGANGINGADGAPGLNGVQGTAGASGTNGTNGTNGANGTNGTSVADILTIPGSIIIRNGTNTTVPLNAGSNGQVLTISGGIPAWENVTSASISGLTVSNFAFPNISQWTNNSGYITALSTDILTNKTIAAGSNTISGLSATNLAAGDFSSKITSGTYSITISGNAATATLATSATTATNFSGSLSGDVTGTQGSTTVAKINGNMLGLTTPTAGNLLVGSGTQWVTHALSNDASINSAGILTLKNTGTAGTYGSALNVPVLITDAAGRVTSVTNTAINGLANANLSGTAGITNANLANSSITINSSGILTGGATVSLGGTITLTATEADTLSRVTGRGASTATALTLNGGVTTTTSNALTLDSGTTGAINIGTSTNAKTITTGNITGATRLNLSAGTGGVFLKGLAAQTNGKLTVCIDNATKQLFTGATAASCNTSSARFKHDIEGITLGLAAVNTLRPVSYAYNSDGEKALGFIAEEAASVDERLIVRDALGLPYALNSDAFIPILTKGIQQLDLKVDGMELTIATSSTTLTGQTSMLTTTILAQAGTMIKDIFNKTAEFFGNVIFHTDVVFLGRPTFNKDTAGHALIRAGESEVSVNFENEYIKAPVVTVSINLVGGIKPDELPMYAVYDSNSQGFKIKLSRVTASDLFFSWIALSVNGENTSISSGQNTPQASVTPTPSMPIEGYIATITPSATASAAKEIIPVQTITESASHSAVLMP